MNGCPRRKATPSTTSEKTLRCAPSRSTGVPGMSRRENSTVAALRPKLPALTTRATTIAVRASLPSPSPSSRLTVDSSANSRAATGTAPYTENSETWLATASRSRGTIDTHIACLAGLVNSPTASTRNWAT